MAVSTLSRRLSEGYGVALFGAALLWVIALVTYAPTDPVWFFTTGLADAPTNFAGRVGAFLAELAFQLVGYGSYLIPALFVVVGWHCFWCRPIEAVYTKLTGAALLLACVTALLSLVLGMVDADGRPFRAGGYVGDQLATWLAAYLGRTGSIVVVLTLLVLAVILATQVSFGRLFAAIARAERDTAVRGMGAFRAWREARRRRLRRGAAVARARTILTPPDASKEARGAKTAAPAAGDSLEGGDELVGASALGVAPDRAASAAGGKRRASLIGKRPSPQLTPSLPLSPPEPAAKAPAERRAGTFALPPLSLLDAPRTERKIDERELMERARLLEEKCREFSVEGSVVQIHPGPVVTTFEFKPDAGVKYARITGLADDLCLAMQAESVLIERIAGKSTVGIQIPNLNREPISLRELLQSEVYQHSSSKLTLALGKTIHGEPFVTDLGTMPHLLIAGSTGTGKSVAINSMISSILFRATPDEVRLIMIDPKRLELGMYEDIPHLLTPVVVDPQQAANALRWAVREMEDRYKTLAAVGVRNIEQFNRNVRHEIEDKANPHEGEPPKPLPYIVVVIDELADLMMVASNEVEESIARLAQMARAVGIHLVLATQRPSVDVITGLIKANLPARISFRVSSKTDSRTILDANGAEQLLGRGDMLYLPPSSSRVSRLHGPYISEQESARLASYLRKQGKPIYNQAITADDKPASGIEMEKDDLYDEAARMVVSTGQASISYLQRRLRIGFSRAARLVDMMEVDGLVSAGTGGKPRDVLVDKHYFDEVDAQLR